jgi:hypothetical protein
MNTQNKTTKASAQPDNVRDNWSTSANQGRYVQLDRDIWENTRRALAQAQDLRDKTEAERDEARKQSDEAAAACERASDLLDAATAQRDELLAAAKGLFEHCVMVHKYWGEKSNQGQGDTAIAHALDAIANCEK